MSQTEAAQTEATQAPKAAPEPEPAPAPVVSEAAREVGAPGAVTDEVEQIAEALHVHAPESRDELPIPDFDNISIGSLRARLRPLTSSSWSPCASGSRHTPTDST